MAGEFSDLEKKLMEGYKSACSNAENKGEEFKFKPLPQGVVRQAMPTLQFS